METSTKNKDLNKELIDAYKNTGKKGLKILSEWESASKVIYRPG